MEDDELVFLGGITENYIEDRGEKIHKEFKQYFQENVFCLEHYIRKKNFKKLHIFPILEVGCIHLKSNVQVYIFYLTCINFSICQGIYDGNVLLSKNDASVYSF